MLRLIKNTQSPSTQKTHTHVEKKWGKKGFGTLDKKKWNLPLISATTRTKVQIVMIKQPFQLETGHSKDPYIFTFISPSFPRICETSGGRQQVCGMEKEGEREGE